MFKYGTEMEHVVQVIPRGEFWHLLPNLKILDTLNNGMQIFQQNPPAVN